MSELSYTTVTGKIPKLLEKLSSSSIPTNADNKWLKSVGFTSSNDATLLGMLNVIGFTDNKKPTQLWKDFRGKDGPLALASALREYYKILYNIYPNAETKENGDLELIVKQHSSAGEQAVAKTVRTFKAFANSADFSNAADTNGPPNHNPKTTPANEQKNKSPSVVKPSPATNIGPNLHIDIQVHISSDASVEQIDSIFSSMAKHLYSGKLKS